MDGEEEMQQTDYSLKKTTRVFSCQIDTRVLFVLFPSNTSFVALLPFARCAELQTLLEALQ